MSNFELLRKRIESKGVQASDIKHSDLLTKEEITSIPVEHVYMWVKTGQWKQKDFKKWLKVLWVIE